MSADPKEFGELTRQAKVFFETETQKDLFTGREDREFAKLFRRGVFATESIPAGTKIESHMIKFVRPATTLTPIDGEKLIGKTTKIEIPKESEVTWDQV